MVYKIYQLFLIDLTILAYFKEEGETPSYTYTYTGQLEYRFNKDIRKQVKDRTRSAHNQKYLEHVKILRLQLRNKT